MLHKYFSWGAVRGSQNPKSVRTLAVHSTPLKYLNYPFNYVHHILFSFFYAEKCICYDKEDKNLLFLLASTLERKCNISVG